MHVIVACVVLALCLTQSASALYCGNDNCYDGTLINIIAASVIDFSRLSVACLIASGFDLSTQSSNCVKLLLLGFIFPSS